MSSSDTARRIADALRENTKLVDDYIDYAKHYANLCADHAEAVCAERFSRLPLQSGQVLLASFPFSQVKPQELDGKLDALAKAATVSHVFVCRRTMTLYVFGRA